MRRERAAAVAMVAMLVAISLAALMRHPPPRTPERIPASVCETWMADALPGVGKKTRDAAAAAIRAGELEKLPPAARARARELFVF